MRDFHQRRMRPPAKVERRAGLWRRDIETMSKLVNEPLSK